MSKEMNEQLLRLREKVLQAEQERLEGAETYSVAESRKCLNGRNDEEVRKLVLESYRGIEAGEGRDCVEFFDELKKELKELKKRRKEN